jgi:hypothetical protein
MRVESIDVNFVKIDLTKLAQKAWKGRHDQNLPEMNVFGDSYKNIGTVWTQSLPSPGGNTSVYTTTEYPPSILDNFSTTLPNNDGVAFNNQRNARNALLWWVICTVPSAGCKRKWANKLLQNNPSVVIFVAYYSQAWCTLLRDNKESIWVEYNGRRFLLA